MQHKSQIFHTISDFKKYIYIIAISDFLNVILIKAQVANHFINIVITTEQTILQMQIRNF